MNYSKRSLGPKAGIAPLFLLLGFVGSCMLSLVCAPMASAATITPELAKKVVVVGKNVVPTIIEARLEIPKIKVNAIIKDMGLTPGGAMAVPGNRVDVGWFSLGTRPGETGSAVVGGHNRWDDGKGVFVHLDQLKKGDLLTVTSAKGVVTTFVVREMKTFAATDEHSGIFDSESGSHLNLITCSGVWNPKTKSYTNRLVIFTDVVPLAKK